MEDLPAEVRDHCRRMAQARRWSPGTEVAYVKTVGRFRALDEGPGAHSYYEWADVEGLAEEGTRWLWETVTVGSDVIAVKQMEVPRDGPVRRYWWRWLEGDASGLTDQPLMPDEEGLIPITREVFYEIWDE